MGDLARKIAETATFEELDIGYNYSTNWTKDRDGNYSLGEEKTVWVDMDKPKACSYQKNGRTITLSRSKSSKKVRPGVEFRGITLRQLRAIMANIDRRCLAEEWVDFKGVKVDPKKANLYEVDQYVIRPYTVRVGKSLVARLPSTGGAQPPRFFVNHWWGQPMYDFVNCVEQLVRDFGRNDSSQDDQRGGGMSIDTPIWVCAFSINQWESSKVEDFQDRVTKAMDVAKRRTVTILDEEGILFTRIWCIFEMSLALIDTQQEEDNEDSEKGLLSLYTPRKHTYTLDNTNQEREAIGIISGGSTSDQNHAPTTTAREKSFPYEVISKALSIKVQNAEASVEDDRIHIFNSIIGRSIEDIDVTPPKEHVKYDELTDALKSIFAASQAALQGAAKERDEKWMAMLVALSKGTKKDNMEFDFGSEGGYIGLTATRACQLISHLPRTIKQLRIANAEFGDGFMEALIQRVREFKNLEILGISDTLTGWGDEKEGQEAGVRLAEVLATNTTIKKLELSRTDLIGVDNVEQWGDALMENTTLTDWDLDGVDAEMVEQLRTKTKDRTPSLEIK